MTESRHQRAPGAASPDTERPQPKAVQLASPRSTIFISKSTPGDDAFALWLAPRLEAAGYHVFADILGLDTGDNWRRKLTATLQDSAAKMLLCCSNETLRRDGVLEEISIASNLSKSLGDPNFILPLKLRRFEPVFGIAALQYTDFEAGWADGLEKLLRTLERQKVPKSSVPIVQPDWAAYHRRRAIALEREPEVLTSNWLRIISVPDDLRFVAATGAMEQAQLARALEAFPYPHVPHAEGLLTFADPADCGSWASDFGGFRTAGTTSYENFIQDGWPEHGIEARVSGAVIVNLLRQAWERHCRELGFLAHAFSSSIAYIADENKVDIAKRIPWGRQGARRNSMLRNIARGKLWEYGVSSQASLFPFPHFRLKSRVLFSEVSGLKKLAVIDNSAVQHRLRRSVCGGWRNKAWHGRMMAFLELIAGESPYLTLAVGDNEYVLVDAMPIQATSPVSARQLNKLGEDAEEMDVTTLTGPFDDPEDDEERKEEI